MREVVSGRYLTAAISRTISVWTFVLLSMPMCEMVGSSARLTLISLPRKPGSASSGLIGLLTYWVRLRGGGQMTFALSRRRRRLLASAYFSSCTARTTVADARWLPMTSMGCPGCTPTGLS